MSSLALSIVSHRPIPLIYIRHRLDTELDTNWTEGPRESYLCRGDLSLGLWLRRSLDGNVSESEIEQGSVLVSPLAYG